MTPEERAGLEEWGDLDALRELYRANPLVQRFFDLADADPDDEPLTLILNVRRRLDITYREALRLGRKLAQTRCCSLVLGRRGLKTRLEWEMSSLKLVAEAAREAPGPSSDRDDADPEPDTGTIAPAADDELRLTIAEAKRGLAAGLGIDIDKIEIVIRA